MVGSILLVIALVLVALALIFLEIFIPSFGLITITAAAMYSLALWIGYRADPTVMHVTIAATIPVLPLTIWLAFKLLPYSPLVLRSGAAEQEQPEPLAECVGREGTVMSDLHPVGKVEIDGARYEAVSRHGMLERGTSVRVVGADSGRLIVIEQANT